MSSLFQVVVIIFTHRSLGPSFPVFKYCDKRFCFIEHKRTKFYTEKIPHRGHRATVL